MFEISNETLKEMQAIKETCKYLECVKCNYFNEETHYCNLYYPYNWQIECEE